MKDYNVTSAGASAEADRQKRIKIYFIMMVIRVISILSLLWLRGWWILLAVFGGVFLPYFAVTIANEPDRRANRRLEKVEELILESSPLDSADEKPTLIVIDDPAPRRKSEQSEQSDDA